VSDEEILWAEEPEAPEKQFKFAASRGGGNEFSVQSKGNFVQVDVPGEGVVTVRSALLMAGALIRSALESAMTYSDGVTEKYLTDALNEGGQFLGMGKAQELVKNLHSTEDQNAYDSGFKDGYDLEHKHGFDS